MSLKKLLLGLVIASISAAGLASCGGTATAVAPAPAPAPVSPPPPPRPTASADGFETIVASPASELEEIKRSMEGKNIPCGIGIGESADEMVARDFSTSQARAELAASLGVQVQRLSESYAQNVGGEAQKIWEEAVRQLTDESLRGSSVYKTIALYNERNGRYKVYSLIILNPAAFKEAISEAASGNEEFEFGLRARKEEMMGKLDAAIAEYEERRGR